MLSFGIVFASTATSSIAEKVMKLRKQQYLPNAGAQKTRPSNTNLFSSIALVKNESQSAQPPVLVAPRRGFEEKIKKRILSYIDSGQSLKALNLLEKHSSKFSSRLEILYLSGVCYEKIGCMIEAVRCFEELIKCSKNECRLNEFENWLLGGTHVELLKCFVKLGDFRSARSIFSSILETMPEDGKVLNDIGLLYLHSGLVKEAQKIFLQALKIEPDNSEYLSNFGISLLEAEKVAASLAAFKLALNINPRNIQAEIGFTMAKFKNGEDNKALSFLEKILSKHPKNYRAHYFKGNIDLEKGLFFDAIDAFDRSIALEPKFISSYLNKAYAYERMGSEVQAKATLAHGLEVCPASPSALFSYSLYLLRDGKLRDGFSGYLNRFCSPKTGARLPDFSQPRWMGDFCIKDKTLLVVHEQGLGDTIQFCRYVNLLPKLAKEIYFEVQEPLVKILSSMETVREGQVKINQLAKSRADFDNYCMLLDLPLILESFSDFPLKDGYLQNQLEHQKKWQQLLGPTKSIRVGLVGSGSKQNKTDRQRSIGLSKLLQCLPDGPDYFCLQKELSGEDKESLAKHPHVREFSSELADFTDTAALISEMDLIVTVDTSVAHLAGSLGKPVWILLAKIADWRWFHDVNTSDWYSSAKLYRQSQVDSWADVLKDVSKDLTALLTSAEYKGYNA